MTQHEIGVSAGEVYFLLSQKGKLSLRKIGELTYTKEAVIYMTLGWLLRENKIAIIEHNGECFFELKECMGHLYY